MLKLVKRLPRYGCTVERRGSKHWRITTPNGTAISAPFSPSTPGALRALIRNLKREGVEL